MAREVVTGETVCAAFGAAYEILYKGQNGFERADDVMHLFRRARVSAIEIEHYHPHALRQWYEGDQLCIVSASTPEVHQQGIESGFFVVPSILGQPSPPSRTVDALVTRPDYLCIHNIFEIEGRLVPSSMIMRGNAIDHNFILSHNGPELTFEPTEAYAALIREQAAQMWACKRP